MKDEERLKFYEEGLKDARYRVDLLASDMWRKTDGSPARTAQIVADLSRLISKYTEIVLKAHD